MTYKNQFVMIFCFTLLMTTPTLSMTSPNGDPWPCSKQEAIEAFRFKILDNPFPTLLPNPYTNQTTASNATIHRVNADHELVCALRYTRLDRSHYELRTITNQQTATALGYTVTHQGRCGVCSNLNDLAVYLAKNLTGPARDCALESEFSDVWTRPVRENAVAYLRADLSARHCFENSIGFTENCARVWTANAINTRQDCFWVCLNSWVHREPYNKPDGSLNNCLQCDEDKSGPVFKYFSGRTRRNSGIHSEIHRPPYQIYNMTHCYF